MRTFKLGTVEDRRFVVLEREGHQVRVIKGNADGTTRQSVKEFPSEPDAVRACDKMAEELLGRGYRERNSRTSDKPPTQPRPARPRPQPQPAPVAVASGDSDLDLSEAGEESDGEPAMVLTRLAPAPSAAVDTPKAKKKPKGKKKKKKAAGGSPGQGDALDKRIVATFVAAGLMVLGVIGFLGYKAFLEPGSIIGHWEGSRTEHEIGKYLTNNAYILILDSARKATMQINESDPSVGTYTLQKDRLKLAFKDEDGETRNTEYRVKVGGATLDLFDPASGQKVVQLIRMHKTPVVGGGGGGGKAGGSPAPAGADAVAALPFDKGADEKLASVGFGAKDGAFALRHPAGWEVDTGARPDNTYSWAKLTRGSDRVRVYADIAGSLMAGPNNNDQEEGSETAPVHGAHLRYKKDAAELLSDYNESPPALFKGAAIGEGRISTFTATGDGLFGGKLRGIRVTFLTNDRRVVVLCEAPTKEYDALLPTFLAICRSLSR